MDYKNYNFADVTAELLKVTRQNVLEEVIKKLREFSINRGDNPYWVLGDLEGWLDEESRNG